MRILFLDGVYVIHMSHMTLWDMAYKSIHPNIRPMRMFLVLAFLRYNVLSNLMDIYTHDRANYFHHIVYIRYKCFRISHYILHKHNPLNYTMTTRHYHLVLLIQQYIQCNQNICATTSDTVRQYIAQNT